MSLMAVSGSDSEKASSARDCSGSSGMSAWPCLLSCCLGYSARCVVVWCFGTGRRGTRESGASSCGVFMCLNVWCHLFPGQAECFSLKSPLLRLAVVVLWQERVSESAGEVVEPRTDSRPSPSMCGVATPRWRLQMCCGGEAVVCWCVSMLSSLWWDMRRCLSAWPLDVLSLSLNTESGGYCPPPRIKWVVPCQVVVVGD